MEPFVSQYKDSTDLVKQTAEARNKARKAAQEREDRHFKLINRLFMYCGLALFIPVLIFNIWRTLVHGG